MFSGWRGCGKVFRRPTTHRGEQRCSPARYRRLLAEPLEDRRLLALGDLLHALADPNTVQVQGGSSFGFAAATEGDLTVVGVPDANIQGISRSGVAYVLNSTTGA